MNPFFIEFYEKSFGMKQVLLDAVIETLTMSLISTVVATIIGFMLAIVLVIADKDGLSPNVYVYKSLDIIIILYVHFPSLS